FDANHVVAIFSCSHFAAPDRRDPDPFSLIGVQYHGFFAVSPRNAGTSRRTMASRSRRSSLSPPAAPLTSDVFGPLPSFRYGARARVRPSAVDHRGRPSSPACLRVRSGPRGTARGEGGEPTPRQRPDVLSAHALRVGVRHGDEGPD